MLSNIISAFIALITILLGAIALTDQIRVEHYHLVISGRGWLFIGVSILLLLLQFVNYRLGITNAKLEFYHYPNVGIVTQEDMLQDKPIYFFIPIYNSGNKIAKDIRINYEVWGAFHNHDLTLVTKRATDLSNIPGDSNLRHSFYLRPSQIIEYTNFYNEGALYITIDIEYKSGDEIKKIHDLFVKNAKDANDVFTKPSREDQASVMDVIIRKGNLNRQ